MQATKFQSAPFGGALALLALTHPRLRVPVHSKCWCRRCHEGAAPSAGVLLPGSLLAVRGDIDGWRRQGTVAKLLQSQSFAPLEKMNGFSLQRDAGKGLERSCIFYNTISQHFRKRGQTSSQISDPGGCRQQHEPVQVAGLTKRAFLFVLLKLCLISFSIFLNSTYSDWFSMGSVGNVAMGGTRVVSGVASLSDRALQLMKETLIFSSPTKPPTCRPMDVKPSQLRFSPAPIQQKETNKCNSWSGANVIKPAGPQMQEWEHGTGRTDNNSLEVFSWPQRAQV